MANVKIKQMWVAIGVFLSLLAPGFSNSKGTGVAAVGICWVNFTDPYTHLPFSDAINTSAFPKVYVYPFFPSLEACQLEVTKKIYCEQRAVQAFMDEVSLNGDFLKRMLIAQVVSRTPFLTHWSCQDLGSRDPSRDFENLLVPKYGWKPVPNPLPPISSNNYKPDPSIEKHIRTFEQVRQVIVKYWEQWSWYDISMFTLILTLAILTVIFFPELVAPLLAALGPAKISAMIGALLALILAKDFIDQKDKDALQQAYQELPQVEQKTWALDDKGDTLTLSQDGKVVYRIKKNDDGDGAIGAGE